MTDRPPHSCSDMAAALTRTDAPIRYGDKLREYGIDYMDGGTSFLSISHCPFCGLRLPPSLRDAWFDRIDELGIDVVDDADDIPEPMRTGAWWRSESGEG